MSWSPGALEKWLSYAADNWRRFLRVIWMLESSSIDQTHKTSRLVSSNHPRPGSALRHQKRPAPLSSVALAPCVFKARWQSHAQEKSPHFQKSRRWPDPDGGRFSWGETEMNSDNPSTPTAACAQDYDISSESSFTEERRRSTAGGGSVSCY